MSTPHVSVLMAVYNAEPYLSQALDSIFAQTFTDFELIVVNDASTDSSPAILDSHRDPRLVVVTNPQNVGLTGSLNKGLKLAKGELIARHDADDISHADRFRQQVERLMAQPALGALGTSYQIIDRQGHILETVCPPATNTEIQGLLPQRNLFCHGSVMLRRNYLEEVGAYRAAFPVAQDYDLWLRLAEHCELANLSALLYQFRFHRNTVSREKYDLQLAYDRLARELAAHRRANGVEAEIPEDVLTFYPPEPARCLVNVRWATYCFYAAGQVDQAAEAITRAEDIVPQPQDRIASWEEWAWFRARRLACLRKDVKEGARFIHWLFTTLPSMDDWPAPQQTIGRLYADQAFLAHQNGLEELVMPYALEAVRHDWRWLRNRGLWVIAWRSLCRR